MRIDTRSPQFAAALDTASRELGLQDYYVSCVRPLFAMPMSQWPQCCGARCEPCMQVVVVVAQRVCELIGIDPHTLG